MGSPCASARARIAKGLQGSTPEPLRLRPHPLSRSPMVPRKQKAPPEGEAKCLKRLVGRVGIEPTTNGSRGGFGLHKYVINQKLATPANSLPSLTKAQLRHNQSGPDTIGIRDPVST